MRENSSQFDRKFLIITKGTICANCQKNCLDKIIFHHIVPIVLGGNDILTNIIPLCDNCHNLIHYNNTKNNNISHSDLIKEGIKKRKEKGLSTGRPHITKKDIPQKFFDYYKKICNNEITITQASKEIPMSRTTIYKYIKLIEQEK